MWQDRQTAGVRFVESLREWQEARWRAETAATARATLAAIEASCQELAAARSEQQRSARRAADEATAQRARITRAQWPHLLTVRAT